MPEHFGRLWWKARTGNLAMMRRHGLSFADIGFLLCLYDESKSESTERLLDGYLTLAEVAGIARSGKLRGWKQAIERLAETPRLDLLEDGVQLDWSGQESSARKPSKEPSTTVNGGFDFRAAHDSGDHSRCRKRGLSTDCPHATKWAKGYPKNHGDGHGENHGGNHPSEQRRAEHKSSDSELLDKTGPAQAPPGQRSPADASTLPGPASENEQGASKQGASKQGASKQGASKRGARARVKLADGTFM